MGKDGNLSTPWTGNKTEIALLQFISKCASDNPQMANAEVIFHTFFANFLRMVFATISTEKLTKMLVEMEIKNPI